MSQPFLLTIAAACVATLLIAGAFGVTLAMKSIDSRFDVVREERDRAINQIRQELSDLKNTIQDVLLRLPQDDNVEIGIDDLVSLQDGESLRVVPTNDARSLPDVAREGKKSIPAGCRWFGAYRDQAGHTFWLFVERSK